MWWLMWIACGAGGALDTPNTPPEWPSSNSAAADAVLPARSAANTAAPADTDTDGGDTDPHDTDAAATTAPATTTPPAAAPAATTPPAAAPQKPPPSPNTKDPR
jgi:hypothetical protein